MYSGIETFLTEESTSWINSLVTESINNEFLITKRDDSEVILFAFFKKGLFPISFIQLGIVTPSIIHQWNAESPIWERCFGKWLMWRALQCAKALAEIVSIESGRFMLNNNSQL